MTKHKYTKFQNLKYILSYPLSIFQMFIPASKRANKISVMIRVRDEEEWISRSLLSLNEFADEVIVVNNNSTDNTLTEIEKVRAKLKYDLIVESESSNDICKVSDHALKLTNYRWIFRWDSDFIAHTSGKQNIKFLREYLLSLNPKKYYLIYPQTFSFAGDLFHVKTGSETNSEGYIHTWHPKLRYVTRGKYEVLSTPLFYKVKRIAHIHFIHIGTAKPLKKLLYRFFWYPWTQRLDDFANIDDYISYISQEQWDSLSPSEIAIKKFKRLILPIRKFNIAEFGHYPELMVEEIKNPKLKITYKDGEPFSRSDFTE